MPELIVHAVLIGALTGLGMWRVRRDELRAIDRRLRALLAHDWQEPFRRMMSSMATAADRMASAFDGFRVRMITGIDQAGLVAAAVRAEQARRVLGRGCYCGWAEIAGLPHDHVARMARGGAPDVLLVPGDILNPYFGLQAWHLMAADVRDRTWPLWPLDVVAMPTDIVLGAGGLIDHDRPALHGIPWARGADNDRELAHA